MNKTDEIVDQFTSKLIKNGIAIEPSNDINWIDPIVKGIPSQYPPSFMSLISRYIFDGFDIDKLTLFANLGDEAFEELCQSIFRDDIIFQTTTSKGFIQFANPSDGSYDPVCFDIRKRKKNKEYPVVRLDHEKILQYEEITIVELLYSSLLDLMKKYTI